MEDTLRVGHPFTFKHNIVLILVLMEDTLRDIFLVEGTRGDKSLNPCFNGRYSQSE